MCWCAVICILNLKSKKAFYLYLLQFSSALAWFVFTSRIIPTPKEHWDINGLFALLVLTQMDIWELFTDQKIINQIMDLVYFASSQSSCTCSHWFSKEIYMWSFSVFMTGSQEDFCCLCILQALLSGTEVYFVNSGQQLRCINYSIGFLSSFLLHFVSEPESLCLFSVHCFYVI